MIGGSWIRMPLGKGLQPPGTRPSGQSLTEFAIGLTLLLLLVSGLADLGRATYIYISLRDAAKEGSSYASIAPADIPGIRARVRDTSNAPIDFTQFSDSQIQVQWAGGTCANSVNVVSVSLTMDFLMVAPFIGGNTFPIQAQATDTILQPPC